MRKLAFAFALLILATSVNTALGLPGLGTQEDPWRIESLTDFNEFATDPNYWDDWTRLETDVNLAGQTYSTAVIAPDTYNSNYSFDGPAYTGAFDGNGHKIIALTINDGGAGNRYLGLFGFIDGGEVRNLDLEGGSVSGTSYYVGGLVGFNSGSISRCNSTSDVSGDNRVGGLVGFNSGSISNCHSTGDVSGTGDYVGGLAGDNYGSVSNCCSTGDVSGDWGVGGLVGWNHGGVSNCYSTGDVSGAGYVGGLVGANWDGSVSNCYSTGSVGGDYSVGGLVGINWGSVSNCYSTGDVSGDDYAGGLVGWNSGSISNCYSTGSVSGHYCVAGLVGWNWSGSVSNCYSTGDVNGTGKHVGGLVGWNYGSVSNCHSTGDVSGDYTVGGLVGLNHWNGSLSNSFWDTDTQTHGVIDSIGDNDGGTVINVEGLHTAEMQDANTYTNAGWDFTTPIWKFCSVPDYPSLYWEECPVLEPTELIAELLEEVGGLELPGGIENSLMAKLNAALRALEDENENNDIAAINTLGAFINAVEAQRGKKIPEAEADALIAAAMEIIDLLSDG